MIPALIRTLDAARRRLAQRFHRDERGVAAVEFALLVPIMVSLFVGAVELSQAITVDRRITQIASSTADLVARESAITTAQLNNVTDVARALLQPYDTAPLKITITSVGANATNINNTKVCWSHSFQGGAATYAQGQTYTLPAGIVDRGGSVVVSEVAYDYTPLVFAFYLPGITTLRDKFFLKPRISSMIQLNTNPICTVS